MDGNYATRKFTPGKNGGGNRIKSLSFRLYVDKWQEHKEAFEFLFQRGRIHGEGIETVVRALLLYRDYLQHYEETGREPTLFDLTEIDESGDK
jgi:hypothetical protein